MGPIPILPVALGLAAGGGVLLQRRHARREQDLEAQVADRTRSLNDTRLQVAKFFREAPLAICLTTLEGRILTVNPAMETMTGYGEADLEQTTTFQLCDTPGLEGAVADNSARGLDVQITTGDGRRVHARLHVSRLDGMAPYALLWVFEDISDEVRAREMLRDAYSALHRRHRIAEGMRDVMVALNSDQPLARVLARIANDACEVLSPTGVVIGTLNDSTETLDVLAQSAAAPGAGTPPAGAVPFTVLKQAIAAGEPLIFPGPEDQPSAGDADPATDGPPAAVLVVPISVAAAAFAGSLLLFFADRQSIAQGEIELATLFAVKAALAIENAQLKASAQEMATASERNRVARELHDSVTQSLYGIILNSDATLLALAAGNSDKAEQRLHLLKEIAREAMTETRLMIYQLRPSILEEQGLETALRERLDAVEVRSGIEVELQVVGDGALPPDVEAELFRAILEGLNNIIKHARARKVQLTVMVLPDCCRVVLSDDGAGFDVTTSTRYGGYGLRTIQERLQHIGGTIKISSEPGKGTSLEMEAPL
ncbi:MAG: histidine kinase [Caldilineales bacterium]